MRPAAMLRVADSVTDCVRPLEPRSHTLHEKYLPLPHQWVIWSRTDPSSASVATRGGGCNHDGPPPVRHSARLDRLDVAAIAFKLHFRNAVKRHPHLREPRGHGVFAGSFHHADGLAFGQVGKAAI